MPTSFQNLIRSRVAGRVEENLETGKIYVFTPGTMYTNFCTGFCWNPPGTGTAVIEAWGAGGSGAQMCCCGGGTPGNAGAYSRRTIQVTATDFVRGTIGNSCGNSSALCLGDVQTQLEYVGHRVATLLTGVCVPKAEQAAEVCVQLALQCSVVL